MSLEKFKYALVVAITIVILGILIAVDTPNNRNLVTLIALLVLGYGSILIETIHPLIAIPLLGFIGFLAVVGIKRLVQWEKWLEAPLAYTLLVLIVFNTGGFIIWAVGHSEGQW